MSTAEDGGGPESEGERAEERERAREDYEEVTETRQGDGRISAKPFFSQLPGNHFIEIQSNTHTQNHVAQFIYSLHYKSLCAHWQI